jgi:pyruvate dehydrogenase E2 component (dihydrolipoamide acetyltransferase)
MPAASNSMEEGTIVGWKVNPGDVIAIGQVICEIETDKATVDVEATHAGRLSRIVAGAGAVVPVKQPIAYLADNDADVDLVAGAGSGAGGIAASAPIEAAEAAPPIASPGYGTSAVPYENGSAATKSDSGRLRVSPAARKLARDRGLDLATVGAGSGPGGRILSTDLQRARAAAATATAPAAKSPAAPAKSSPAIAPAPPVTTTGAPARKPLSKMRKAIANNLQTSKQTVPHFYLKATVLADTLFDFYKAHKATTGCTLNDVILLALGRCIAQFPAFRSRIEGNELVELPRANIGVAVSVDDGLVVPCILNVDGHTLATLPAESKRIVEGARKGKLENVGKAVFSVSNMGMLGVEEFTAIINPPESGILAVAGVKEELIVKDGAMRIAKTMKLTLSVDHRVVDGALAAAFMNRLKELLEHPEAML